MPDLDEFTRHRLVTEWAKPDPRLDLISMSDDEFTDLLEAVSGSMDMMNRTTILLYEAAKRLRRLTPPSGS